MPPLPTVLRRRARTVAVLAAASAALAACSTEPAAGSAGVPSPSSTAGTPTSPPTGPAPTTAPDQETEPVQVRLTVHDTVLTATLTDNATAEALVAQLPLTLVLSDFSDAEKLIELPERLPTDGAPEGIDPSPGDIAYFAPWGNLALYHGDAPYFAGIVELGRFDGGLDVLAGLPDGSPVRIERI